MKHNIQNRSAFSFWLRGYQISATFSHISQTIRGFCQGSQPFSDFLYLRSRTKNPRTDRGQPLLFGYSACYCSTDNVSLCACGILSTCEVAQRTWLQTNKLTAVNPHFIIHERSLEKERKSRDVSAMTNRKWIYLFILVFWWKKLINEFSGAKFNYLPTPLVLPGQRTENTTQQNKQHINYLSQMFHNICCTHSFQPRTYPSKSWVDRSSLWPHFAPPVPPQLCRLPHMFPPGYRSSWCQRLQCRCNLLQYRTDPPCGCVSEGRWSATAPSGCCWPYDRAWGLLDSRDLQEYISTYWHF